MKKILLLVFFGIITFNLILSAWFVIHQDLNFSTEIARDFFLLQEIDIKKIVLIGPSSSTGLFHGPLWSYLNYPAYVIGNGNPVIVGWWWVVLVEIFLITNFFIAKKLFNNATAYLFVLMSSVYMVYHSYRFYNPYGAMLLLPAFFFFFIQYNKTFKAKYLLFHLTIASAIIQFQMAVGIPLTILSFTFIAVALIKNRKKILHIFLFGVVGILLANFVIFDLRHEHLLSQLLLKFLTSSSREHMSYITLIQDRINLMFQGTEILRRDAGGRNFILFFILLGFLIVQVRDKKYRLIYYSFLYFYVGFFALSLVNVGGPLLYFYLFPLFPLVFLIFSSFITSQYKKTFITIFAVVFILNMYAAISDTYDASKTLIGKDIYSWKFLYNASKTLYQNSPEEFGYFVYSPNVVAFEGKYAMWYAGKEFQDKTAHYFTKKPTTMMYVAPPPQNNPHMKDDWWRLNQVHITSSPSSTIRFENGYKVEKYNLSEDEISIPFDPGIDPGLHFR